MGAKKHPAEGKYLNILIVSTMAKVTKKKAKAKSKKDSSDSDEEAEHYNFEILTSDQTLNEIRDVRNGQFNPMCAQNAQWIKHSCRILVI